MTTSAPFTTSTRYPAGDARCPGFPFHSYLL